MYTYAFDDGIRGAWATLAERKTLISENGNFFTAS